MSDEMLVDARGHRCPVPTLRLRRAVEIAPAGQLIRVIADDPLAKIDIPHFAAQAGLTMVSFDCQAQISRFLLRLPA